MKISRSSMAVLAAGVIAVVAAFSVGANAQTSSAERIIGYAVYSQSQHVLLQRPDGRLRACKINRETPLRSPRWDCDTLPALP